MGSENLTRWYAVGTQPGRELVAKAHLLRQNFTCFLPMQEKTVSHARRLTTGRRSYFPGYLFVALDLRIDRWRAINGTVGVRNIVSTADCPAPVSRGFVEALQAHVDADGLIRAGSLSRKGDKVELQVGPFAGMVGEWDRMQGAQRVRVLVSMLNSSVPVLVDAQSLR